MINKCMMSYVGLPAKEVGVGIIPDNWKVQKDA